jgi:hypothetical protein
MKLRGFGSRRAEPAEHARMPHASTQCEPAADSECHVTWCFLPEKKHGTAPHVFCGEWREVMIWVPYGRVLERGLREATSAQECREAIAQTKLTRPR